MTNQKMARGHLTEELYSREDAEGALREARFVLEICEEFVEGSRR